MSPAKRVCFPFVGDTVGGSHISALTLIKHLDPKRYQPIIVLHEIGPLAAHLRDAEIGFLHLPIAAYLEPPYAKLEALWLLLRTAPPLVRFLRQHRINLVHTNDFRMHGAWALAGRLAGARLVWHQRTFSFGKDRVKNLLSRLVHRIVCISDFTAQSLPAFLAAKAETIRNPLGIDTRAPDRTVCRQNLERELPLRPDQAVVGFFGNMMDQKRPLIFVEAAARMSRDSKRSFAFLLFGADRHDYGTTIRRLARNLGIEASIHLMGFRTPAEPWMAACDLVLAPAVNEGFGRILIEAMSVGTPVIAADSGGHREIICHEINGLLVAPDDATAMAQAAIRLLDAPDSAARLTRCATAYVRETYAAERHASAIMAAYDELLGPQKNCREPATQADGNRPSKSLL